MASSPGPNPNPDPDPDPDPNPNPDPDPNPNPNPNPNPDLTLTPTLRRELRDLLNPKSKEKLKIRNGKQGTYVQGVKKMAVASYDEIEKVQEVGNSNRTVGATLMNATSSRAHTIVTISLTQLIKEDGASRISPVYLPYISAVFLPCTSPL